MDAWTTQPAIEPSERCGGHTSQLKIEQVLILQ